MAERKNFLDREYEKKNEKDRDLDGKWSKFYPEELKGVKPHLTTTEEFAKMLGKKLLKTVK